MLVALCGAIGAGKDTVGGLLVKQHGFRNMSFAAPLKDWALQLFAELGMEYRHAWGTQADKAEPLSQIIGPSGEPRTGRQILEILGTEGGRAVMPSLWTTLALRRAQAFVSHGQSVVLTDARFATEIDGVREAGGFVWEVVKIGGEQRTSDHASDREWRKLPKDGIVMARAGDITALEREVGDILAVGGRRHGALLNQP
jgi:hypothetical protein